MAKKKKTRTTFTGRQIAELEKSSENNISNAMATKLYMAKNSRKEHELIKPPTVQPRKILTENGLVVGDIYDSD